MKEPRDADRKDTCHRWRGIHRLECCVYEGMEATYESQRYEMISFLYGFPVMISVRSRIG